MRPRSEGIRRMEIRLSLNKLEGGKQQIPHPIPLTVLFSQRSRGMRMLRSEGMMNLTQGHLTALSQNLYRVEPDLISD